MNYIEKNRNNILLISAGVIIAIGLLIWALQNKNYTAEDIVASVTPEVITLGEPVNFEDKSLFGKTRKWVFTGGYETQDKKGVYIFKNTGFKEIELTIDGEFSRIFKILVQDPKLVAAKDSIKLPTYIKAQTVGNQLSIIPFQAISDAKTYQWSFGESGVVDAADKNPTYTYKNAGSYTVTLRTDADAEAITHFITILPAYPNEEIEIKAPVATREERVSMVNDDFREHLQKIANGSNFNDHYNYLMRTYLCNKPKVSVSVNDKSTSFYSYCMNLQFDKNNLIQEVTLTTDPGEKCITKVDVKQSKD